MSKLNINRELGFIAGAIVFVLLVAIAHVFAALLALGACVFAFFAGQLIERKLSSRETNHVSSVFDKSG